jgi:CheY-like chemotaxis protein/anti-sigma regulatory factor (Ser/Thr protein kinase)
VDLVNDLLDVARIESGQYEIAPRSCDLRETLEEVAALMAPRLDDKHQRLVVEISEPRPAALVDPARVRQIVTNLLTNAHQYTGEHGTITLRLDADARATRIVVSDTGRGMAAEDVRHVFDRFYRGASSDRRSPGTGLGLPIVKSLVELHGGTIDVRSELGVGTTFAIALPSAAGGPRSYAPPSRLASRRVLIVDDEPPLAALIARQLEPLGMETVQVHSGQAALERLRSEHFDAMTLDVLMPGMNGFDVLDTIRADPHLRSLPVIFVSVSSTLSRLDGEWAVAKPIDRQRLSDVLHSAIQANRSRVLVLAPDALRIQLAPALAGLGVEYRWESNAERAVSAGADELFEVALVHSSMSEALRLVESAALRGRRGGRSLILFSTGDGDGTAGGVGMPVFPLAQAIEALRTMLGTESGAASPR